MDENHEIQELEKVPDLSLVLNGGSNVMDGATIPIKWFFSEELVEKEPTHILLVDLSEKKGEEKFYNLGRRYVVKIDKGIKYIQVFNSGDHILLALAFKSEMKANTFLETDSSGYKKMIPLTNIEAKEGNWEDSLASCVKKFTVPKELFAKKPESKWGKLWWKYLFWPKQAKPRDECQTRKLSWFFSWMKFPFFVLFNLLYSLYTVIASTLILFFGFWPTNIIMRILYPVENNWTLDVRAEGRYTEFLNIYDKHGFETGKRMWFSSFHITLIIILGIINYILFVNDFTNSYIGFFLGTLLIFGVLVPLVINMMVKRWDKDEGIAIITGAAVFFFLSLYSVIFYRAPEQALATRIILYTISGLILGAITFFGIFAVFQDNIEELWEKIQEESREKKGVNKKYQDYLRENFSRKIDTADPQELSETFDSNETGRNVYAKFWATKAQICKPYEE